MDTVDIPSETVPPEMKPCEQILRRATELKKHEPVVAYWCSFSAAQKALKVPNRSKEGTKWLMSLLDSLEQMKGVLTTNEAVTNEAAGAACIENFALKVFMSADNDDRNGQTGKGTIRRFVVAGQFIEVLRCFENGMTEEMEQKLQYARWKAADGAKALREGRVPVSGPPIPEPEFDPFPTLPSDEPSGTNTPPARGSFSNTARPTVHPASPAGSGTPTNQSPAHHARANLPSIDTSGEGSRTPQRTYSTGSGAWSTVATPGLADSEEGEKRFNLPDIASSTESSDPSATLIGTGNGNDGEKKNVRFMGPDGAPLSPAQTMVSVDSYDAPAAPPPSTFAPSPTKDKPTGQRGDSNVTTNGRPRTDSSANVTGSGQSGMNGLQRPRADSASKSHPTSHNITAVPPPPPPSLVSYPSAPPAGNGLGLTSPPPSAPPAHAVPGPTITPNRKQLEQIQKHARWAISALDFDDYETARSELRKALGMLGG